MMKANGDLHDASVQVSGLPVGAPPDLETIEARRLQLWSLTLLLLLCSTAALGLVTFWGQVILPSWMSPQWVNAVLIGLTVLFCIYALEKEGQLSRLTRELIDERVLTASLTHRLHEANALLEAGKAVNLGLELGEVLQRILGSAVDLLEGRDGSIMLVRGHDELRTVCTTDRSAARGATVRIGEGIAGRVAANRQPLLVNGTIEWEHYQEGRGPRSASSISVPLVHRERILGVLNVNARPGKTYGTHDLRALSLFGEQAAAAIANAQLYENQRLAASQSAYQALHDPLTGLPNRILLHDRVTNALARGRRRGESPCLLFIDIDDFKRVNDSLGHGAGDAVLVDLAERLRSSIRAADTVARFGGDEFGVLLDGVASVEEAMQTVARIQENFARPIRLEDHELRFRASVGVAMVTDASIAPDQLLRDALAALHAAKSTGKGQAVVFEDSMHTEAMRRLEVEQDLGRALEGEGLELHFQPVIRLDTRRVVAVEALLRWNHPREGLLAAGAFLPVAEQAGFVPSMDPWVLQRALAALGEIDRRSDGAPKLAMHVNLSPSTLQRPDVVDAVGACLEAARVEPHRLVVEITENAFLDDAPQVTARLTGLRALGVRLALDDFGTGYSSLSYLRRFPVDVVKIDRLFVDGLDTDHSSPPLVDAIVRLGHGLAFDVVAEGIEKTSQEERLLDLGCTFGQGFLFSTALPLRDLLGFLDGDEPEPGARE